MVELTHVIRRRQSLIAVFSDISDEHTRIALSLTYLIFLGMMTMMMTMTKT